MAYKNKVYVSFDADNNIHYYWLMKAWNQNKEIDFSFYDAHNINNNYNKSEESIKSALMERFRNTKIFVLLVGEHTKYLYRFVRWEIEQAIKRKLPIIVVNLNGKRSIDYDLCPAILRNQLAIHISYNASILQYALLHWPDSYEKYKKADESGPYYYGDNVYEKLGI